MKYKQYLNERGLAHLLPILLGTVTIAVIAVAIVVATQQGHKAAQIETSNSATSQLSGAAKAGTVTTPTPTPASTPAPAAAAPASCNRAQTMYVTNSGGLRLRAEAAETATVVMTMPYRAAVHVGCLASGWYSAEYAGQTGFASAAYLAASQPAVSVITHPTTANCNGQDFTVYASASGGAKIYTQEDEGTGVVQTLAVGTAMMVHCGSSYPGWVEYGSHSAKANDVSLTRP
jgi:hypothetical protein